MKQISLLLSAVVLLAACGTSKEQSTISNSKTEMASTVDSIAGNQITARLRMKPVIQAGDALELQFTVYNRSSSKQSFCKWHTPFEPPMSKYLDIKGPQETEAQYRGIMAKRIMPPPADSYIEVKPNDSLSVKVDLSKVYLLDKAGVYVVRYNAQEISGLIVKDSISFVYKK